jgi:hypothetical protein
LSEEQAYSYSNVIVEDFSEQGNPLKQSKKSVGLLQSIKSKATV